MAFRGEFEVPVGANVFPVPIGASIGTPQKSPWSAAFVDPKQRVTSKSHVVFGMVSQFEWKGSGLLSMKTVLNHHVDIHCGGGIHRIEPDTYLILNKGTEYSFLMKGGQPIQGLSAFFDESSIRAAIDTRNAQAQLDSPESSKSASLDFVERLYPNDAALQKLRKIGSMIEEFGTDSLWLQESLVELLTLILAAQSACADEIATVDASRADTKLELYRRLYKARDYAHASLDQPISIDDLAYVACLSTNYFLRTFRDLFGQTPHQYIVELRLQKAKQLLLQSNSSVSDICQQVGFQSLGSFSWLFKKRIGLSPDQFRRAAPRRYII